MNTKTKRRHTDMQRPEKHGEREREIYIYIERERGCVCVKRDSECEKETLRVWVSLKREIR